MKLAAPRSPTFSEDMNEDALIALARAGNEQAVRALVKRCNQQLFRTVRGVVRDDAEAEDVVQAAYVRAFTGLDGFRGDASFSTWLTRIALNEALGRLRRRRPTVDLAEIDRPAQPERGNVIMFPMSPPPESPEGEVGREQVRRFLERTVDALPDHFRLVFILRDIEGLSTGETAARLSIPRETVKTRLHRARKHMRAEIEKTLAPQFSELFPFAGKRCERMTENVVARLVDKGWIGS